MLLYLLLVLLPFIALFNRLFVQWPPANWEGKDTSLALWDLTEQSYDFRYFIFERISVQRVLLDPGQEDSKLQHPMNVNMFFLRYSFPSSLSLSFMRPASKSASISSTKIWVHLKVHLRTAYVWITWYAHFKISILGSTADLLILDLWRWGQENCVFNKVFR